MGTDSSNVVGGLVMSDELDALLDRVEDSALRAELRGQIEHLRRKRSFGLVFESHLPERVRLPDHPIRRGASVVERDAPADAQHREVLLITGETAVLDDDGQTVEASCDELVVIAEFGQPIYPGLRRLGSIDRGGDKPAHIVIEGENYHALEALRFSHTAKVDCIYIDPPYNTGARDWKYDNDYVDADDGYRHSKWLAFMERRLRLARDLLRADNSILIVTIDEKECLRLGLLLEQVFADCRTQMVSITISPRGTSRSSGVLSNRRVRFLRFHRRRCSVSAAWPWRRWGGALALPAPNATKPRAWFPPEPVLRDLRRPRQSRDRGDR